MSIQEQIEWHEVTEQLPDDDATVLMYMPEQDEPVWLGWHDDGKWFSIDGFEMDDVQRWAPLPSGGEQKANG